MKWIPDSSGRFGVRPQYQRNELDSECEGIINSFLRAKYGSINLPISTDDLAIMLELDTSDLDLYADLSSLGHDVDGVTEFLPGKKPRVRISGALSMNSNLSRRLRTTLAHEYAHVRLHAFLWTLQLDPEDRFWSRLSRQHNRYQQLRERFEPLKNTELPAMAASRSGFLVDRTHSPQGTTDGDTSDWMEMQANYASRAILMPLTALKHLGFQGASKESHALEAPPETQEQLEARLADAFDVPIDDVRVRLAQLKPSSGSILI